MLGHLVSTSRETPPDFGIAAFLRKTMSGLQPARLLALLSDTLHAHPRKEPHPQ